MRAIRWRLGLPWIWLGIALGFIADVHFWQWQFFVVLVPMAVLDAWAHSWPEKRA